jgi:hypothetical protein
VEHLDQVQLTLIMEASTLTLLELQALDLPMEQMVVAEAETHFILVEEEMAVMVALALQITGQ